MEESVDTDGNISLVIQCSGKSGFIDILDMFMITFRIPYKEIESCNSNNDPTLIYFESKINYSCRTE